MVDIRLPAELRAALDALPSRDARERAAALSSAYRAMQPSSAAVVGRGDAAAYVATRMPATYAATMTALNETAARLPGLAPRTLLDAGAGPGTASWGATETFETIETVLMLDHNAALLDIAADIAAASSRPALTAAGRVNGSLTRLPQSDRRFDLVVASYALTELADGEVVDAARALWARCDGAMVIVEPGRTRDYHRLMLMRAALIAAGARVVAPCPHEEACPLPQGDWCHFSVRLPRSRAHRQAKGGALGYEDEKFSYLVVARTGVVGAPAAARVIGPPVMRKFEVEAPLCTAAGLAAHVVRKQDAPAFKMARKLAWGDALD